LQNHYNYFFDNISNTYNFLTKNNILYRVAFIVDDTFNTISGEDIPNVFQLVVEKAYPGLEPFDPKISKTIESIILRFFNNIENALIYVCSEEKDKAKARYLIFDRWYKDSKYRHDITKIDNIIEINSKNIESQVLYTSFLLHKQNPNYDKLLEIFNRIQQVLNEEK
jgi:hypothetical protein